MINFHVFLVINLVPLLTSVRGEVYTSMAELKDLIDTENALINIMKEYIQREEQKISNLKRYYDLYQKQHKKAIRDVELYLSNPINAYSLIKRLSTDWSQVETLLSSDTTKEAMDNLTSLRTSAYMKFPNQEDLIGAITGLIRLQRTYKLDPSSLANGEINGVKYSSELSAADCFEIGRISYDHEYITLSKLWMEEADARLKREADKTIEYSELLEYLAYSTYRAGNTSLALDLTNKLLKIVPTNERAVRNVLYYEAELKNLTADASKNSNVISEEATTRQLPVDTKYFGNYGHLCRGELAQSEEYRAKLKCKYLSRNDPFLKIGPFKVEEVHLDPELYIFHDVLSDLEIETVKILALPRFQRAQIRGNGKVLKAKSNYRVSKVAWLENELHLHIADISQRVADMTGLTMKTAEDLQVLNYGVGGHYEPHYDFYSTKKENVRSWGNGDRIGTVLFYLSDVAQGGATVFPVMNATVWPKKGTAAFWYNLHASGDLDIRTRHASCPVLVGSKWVSTKWIHEKYQEFLRPCTKDLPSNDTIFDY